jgi:hypothetical protein
MTTYRERREARAERYRGWAAKRVERAEAVFKANEPFTSDYAFNTQPGHIPERARIIKREDAAHRSLAKARSMAGRADGIEDQLAVSIYSDDEDAIERLAERIAKLEAERNRIKAYNKSVRAGAADLSLLDASQRRDLETHLRFSPVSYIERKGAVFPSYGLSNLSGNISRQRKRLEQLQRQAAAKEAQS